MKFAQLEETPTLEHEGQKQASAVHRWPRVLIVMGSLSPGGTELNALKTARLLAGDGAEMQLFAITDGGELRSEFDCLMSINSFPLRGFGSRHHISAAINFRRVLQAFCPDVIHVQDAYAAAFVLLCPWSFTQRVVINRRWMSGSRKLLDRLNMMAYRRFGLVAVNSTALMHDVQDEVGENVSVVLTRNFVETSSEPANLIAQRSDWRRLHSIPEHAVVICCVARPEYGKRHDLLLRALLSLRAKLKMDIRLVIVGDGAHRRTLEALASELGVSEYARFVGHLKDTRSAVRASDIACLCSDREGMPNSLIEAAAEGLPIVASDIGGNREIVVHGQTGLLFKAGQENELVSGLGELIEAPELRREMGRAAKLMVNDMFSVSAYRIALRRAYGFQ